MNTTSLRPGVMTVMSEMGRAGKRLELIGACEASAGNISVFIGWDTGPVDEIFPLTDEYKLPYPVPTMAGGTFIVTGSGRRLPDIADNPTGSLGLIRVSDDGLSAKMRTSPGRLFDNLTCEFNSHLAVHQDRVSRTGGSFSAIIHAQPLHMTFLSHIKTYQDQVTLNKRLYRWQAECLMQIPDGIGYIPFHTPGSCELESDNIEKLRKHVIVLWAKHGVMSRADDSVLHACDFIEYLETSARYEFMNLQIGEPGEGLLPEEIEEVVKTFNIDQDIF